MLDDFNQTLDIDDLNSKMNTIISTMINST